VPFLAAKGLAINILNFLNILTNDKYRHYGETDNTKHNLLYKPVTQAKQLSILERDYSKIKINESFSRTN